MISNFLPLSAPYSSLLSLSFFCILNCAEIKIKPSNSSSSYDPLASANNQKHHLLIIRLKHPTSSNYPPLQPLLFLLHTEEKMDGFFFLPLSRTHCDRPSKWRRRKSFTECSLKTANSASAVK